MEPQQVVDRYFQLQHAQVESQRSPDQQLQVWLLDICNLPCLKTYIHVSSRQIARWSGLHRDPVLQTALQEYCHIEGLATSTCSLSLHAKYMTIREATGWTQASDERWLQAVCLLLGDAVPFRFHWPQNMELRVNDVAYKPYGRPVNQKIGNNVRDEPVNLERLVFAGRNRLRLMARDGRRFCAAVLSVRRRSLQAVKDLMAPEETLEAALNRVRSEVAYPPYRSLLLASRDKSFC